MRRTDAREIQIKSVLDSIENVQKSKAPAVFILAGRDTLVAPEYQKKVVEAYAGQKQVISMPAADHNDPLTREASEQFEKDLNWLWKSALNQDNATLQNP